MLKITLERPTTTLLRDIKNEKNTMDNIAETYALAMTSNKHIDWRSINMAIINRWGCNGLQYIKNKANISLCFYE